MSILLTWLLFVLFLRFAYSRISAYIASAAA